MNLHKLILIVPNKHLSRKILLTDLALKLLPCVLNRVIRMLLSDFTFGPLLQAGEVDVLLIAFTVARRDKVVLVKGSLKAV